jgi:hypothetical protein
MISMTAWIYIIKTMLKSKSKKDEIRTKIITTCLSSKRRIDGAYQVNYDKVWENIIMKDENCLNALEELKIYSVDKLMNYYMEMKYKFEKYTYPRKHRKYG